MEQELPINSSKKKLANITTYLNNNKKLLISLLSVFLILILSFFLFLEFKKKKRIEISDRFNKLIINYENTQNLPLIKKELIELVLSKDKTYAPLSLYFLIDNKLIKSRDKINELFDLLIKNNKLEKEVKNLIIYKKALLNSSFVDESELLESIRPILNTETLWQPHGLILLGDYFVSKGENIKAKEFYQKIFTIKNLHRDFYYHASSQLAMIGNE